jgi:hypothetical protein
VAVVLSNARGEAQFDSFELLGVSLNGVRAFRGMVRQKSQRFCRTRRDGGMGDDHPRHLWTPPTPDLMPCHPPSASLGQVLSLGYQTLMDGASQQGDAVPADLVAEVLAGDADA